LEAVVNEEDESSQQSRYRREGKACAKGGSRLLLINFVDGEIDRQTKVSQN
jgi:hypothetical protein